jgi:hypothetical protein
MKKETFDDFLAQAIDDNVYGLIKVGCFDNEMSLEENWKKNYHLQLYFNCKRHLILKIT